MSIATGNKRTSNLIGSSENKVKTSDINIRPCRCEECAIVLKIWKEAGSTPSVSDSLESLELILQEDGDLLLVAELDDHIVGTVMGGWDGWRGNIYRLAVLPEYRRQGIGQALVLETEKRLAQRGARKISVLVEQEEDLAIAFWDSLKDDGYKRDSRFIRYAKVL